MNQQVLKAADSLDYHPEWLFTGMGAQDIEITARILQGTHPEQMKHVFGLGDLPLYVSGIDDPQVNWFNWYWGPNQGVYSAGTVGHALPRERGREPRGAEAHAADLPAGPVQHAGLRRRGEQPGAELHVRHGAVARPPVRRVLAGGTRLRDHVVEPHRRRARARSSSTTAPAGSCTSTTPSATPPVQWKKGEPKLFDTSNSISQFDGLPASDAVPDYPCKGCPSTKS